VSSTEYQRLGAFMVHSASNLVTDGQATANSPENVEALDFVKSMLEAGSMQTIGEVGAGWGGEAFGTQKAAMTIEGNWIAGAMTNYFPDVQYQVAPLPAGPAGPGSLSFTNCWGIATDSDSQAAAKDFVAFMTTPEQQMEFAKGFGVMPSVQSAADEYAAEFPENAAFIEQAEVADTVPNQPGVAPGHRRPQRAAGELGDRRSEGHPRHRPDQPRGRAGRIAMASRRSRSSAQNQTAAGWLFTAPVVVILGVFLFVPVGMAAWVSVSDWTGRGSPFSANVNFVGAENYTELLVGGGLTTADFGTSLRNNLWYVVLVVPLQTAVALTLAVLVGRRMFRGRGFFRTAFYFPSVTSSVVFLFLFSASGTVNAILAKLSIDGPNWFNDPRGIFHIALSWFGVEAPPSVLADHGLLGVSWWNWLAGPSVAMCVWIVLAIFTTSGTFMLLFIAALQNIPGEVDEAAMVDGANAWQRFFGVTLPQLRPTMFTVLTLGLIGTWQVFEQIYVGTQGGPSKTTLTPAYLSYTSSFERQDWGPRSRDLVHPVRDHRVLHRASALPPARAGHIAKTASTPQSGCGRRQPMTDTRTTAAAATTLPTDTGVGRRRVNPINVLIYGLLVVLAAIYIYPFWSSSPPRSRRIRTLRATRPHLLRIRRPPLHTRSCSPARTSRCGRSTRCSSPSSSPLGGSSSIPLPVTPWHDCGSAAEEQCSLRSSPSWPCRAWCCLSPGSWSSTSSASTTPMPA
jgi:multiple sugar transport system permease protein